LANHSFILNDIGSKNCDRIKVNVHKHFLRTLRKWIKKFFCEREISVCFRFHHTCPTSRSFRYGWFWIFATVRFGIFGFGEPNFFSAPNLKLKNDQTESIAVSNWSKLIYHQSPTETTWSRSWTNKTLLFTNTCLQKLKFFALNIHSRRPG
jgi:hypothetical protein